MNWKLVWWAIFSSLPQPIGAVIAFYFVRIAREFLPFGFGFAAGAMVFLVLTEFIPEALEPESASRAAAASCSPASLPVCRRWCRWRLFRRGASSG